MHDWVVSTKDYDFSDKTVLRVDPVLDKDGNQVYQTDAEGKQILDKDGNPIPKVINITIIDIYREEFLERFNLHYTLIYYVWTFFFLMVDQRAKNMFLTYWKDTDRFYPYFYDNDTCLGINNEGQMVFDYYHEDTDRLPNGTKVYNGQDSTLWVKFREAFAKEIQECYYDLRRNGKLNYEVVHKYFVDNQSKKWAEAIYNEDSDFKYISMARKSNSTDGTVDTTNLYQVRGTGEHHLEYFLEGRLNYCDSKWLAPEYEDDKIVLRVNTPDVTSSVKPNANITVTPFSCMYTGVKYRANGTLQQFRTPNNVAQEFIAPADNFNDTETFIYGASQLSSIGDLSPLYCNYCDISKAVKLIELKLGSTDPDYQSQLNHLGLGPNRLLKKLDIRNCKSLQTPVDVTGCINIEEVYAEGSGITSLNLAESGYLKVVHLPGSVIKIEFKNQQFLEDYQCEGYDNLEKLIIESTAGLPLDELLLNSPKLERIRLVNIDWDTTADTLETVYHKLKTLKGLDEKGYNIETPVVSGIIKVPELSDELLAEINADFPELMISVAGVVLCTVTYYNYDGSVIKTMTVEYGADAPDIVNDPEYNYPVPVKPNTDDYRYEYKGWSTSLENITRSTAIVASFTTYYAVRFYNDGNEAYKVFVTRGTVVPDPIGEHIQEPTKDRTVSHTYTFIGWDRDMNNAITDVTNVHAVYEERIRTYEIRFYNEDYLIDDNVDPIDVYQVDYGTYPKYEGKTPIKLFVKYPEDYTFLGWTPGIDMVKGDAIYVARFSESNHILDDWATVKANIANGTYKEKYPLGIMQRVPLNGEDIDVVLVDYDHDDMENGNKAGMTFIAKHLLPYNYRMFKEGGNNMYGWRDSLAREHLNSEVFYQLPRDLQDVVIPVVKKCAIGGYAPTAEETQSVVDKLWIPAYVEISDEAYAKNNPIYAAEGTTYKWFTGANKEELDARRTKRTTTSGTGMRYWLRTPQARSGSIYYMVTGAGEPSAMYSGSLPRGIALSFCIG